MMLFYNKAENILKILISITIARIFTMEEECMTNNLRGIKWHAPLKVFK